MKSDRSKQLWLQGCSSVTGFFCPSHLWLKSVTLPTNNKDRPLIDSIALLWRPLWKKSSENMAYTTVNSQWVTWTAFAFLYELWVFKVMFLVLRISHNVLWSYLLPPSSSQITSPSLYSLKYLHSLPPLIFPPLPIKFSLCWSVARALGATLLKEMDFGSLSGNQMPTAPQLGVGLCPPSLLHSGTLSDLAL